MGRQRVRHTAAHIQKSGCWQSLGGIRLLFPASERYCTGLSLSIAGKAPITPS